MTYNDGTWTDEKPEVGKRYWFARKPNDSHGFYRKPQLLTMMSGDLFYWDAWIETGYLRSVHPIPDPTPPPLPSKEPR